MKIKKIILWTILTVFLFSSLFMTGCNKNKDDIKEFKEKITDIVINNKSDFKIVCDENSSVSVKFAASEMQSLIKNLTNVEIPIIDDNGLSFNQQSKYISIGKTSLLNQSKLNLDYDKLTDDGFILKTKYNSLFIDANNDRGIIYGVYDYLENVAGIRFIAYDETYYPSTNSLALVDTYRISSPDFAYRQMNIAPLYKWGEDFDYEYDPKFVARMRANGQFGKDVMVDYGGTLETEHYHNLPAFTHNVFKWVDPEKYPPEKYPNLYWESNGKLLEVCLTNGITDDGQIDESLDISTIKVALQSLKQWILDSKENEVYYMFGQMDNEVPCRCDKCRAATRKYKRSGMMIRFCNILAREGQKFADEVAPGKKVNIIHFAYTYNEAPPIDRQGNLLDKSCKPESNVYIILAPIFANYYEPYGSDKQVSSVNRTFEDWQKVHDKFFVWTYCADFQNNFWYYPGTRPMQDNLKYLKQKNVKSVFFETSCGNYRLPDRARDAYVALKLMWDNSLDVEKLKDEFNLRYYDADAYPFIQQYYKVFDEHIEYQVANNDLQFIAMGAFKPQANNHDVRFYSYDFLNSQIELLNEAIRAVQNSNSSQERKNIIIERIKQLQLMPRYMILENYSTYYPGLDYAKKVYATKFFDDCSQLKELFYKAKVGINTLKEKYL